ncbi:MAG: hypothetical protein Q8P67_23235 [archaeon]|nr:hypothetical protein [archaeon]
MQSPHAFLELEQVNSSGVAFLAFQVRIGFDPFIFLLSEFTFSLFSLSFHSFFFSLEREREREIKRKRKEING